MNPVTIKPLTVFSDERGWVFEPATGKQLARQKNAHLVISLPGQVRGNHFHEIATETVAVFGPALVRFRENDSLKDITVAEGEAIQFVFPPGVPHAILNTGEMPLVLIAFSDRPYLSDSPDTFSYRLI